VEVGGTLFAALHKLGLVQRTYLYLVAKSLGPGAISAYPDNTLFERSHRLSWQSMDDNILLRIDWNETECLLV
jgi:hypothetical protein